MSDLPKIDNPYGLLYKQDVLIQRQYFVEMTKLLGITVMYTYPKVIGDNSDELSALPSQKEYSIYGEQRGKYEDWIPIGCIFEEYPTQQSLRKLGWLTELQENASIIHLPYDTPGLQRGSLVVVPMGVNSNTGRLFKVTRLSNIMLYPASISCEIVPEWENSLSESQVNNFSESNFNVLFDPEELEED